MSSVIGADGLTKALSPIILKTMREPEMMSTVWSMVASLTVAP